ncbi:MAG: sigma-70 family RNA polymerase sigma factor [Pirellulaceae bacterium]|nr:sigma-70 family RNA polymerase sigma factor [Pirellulaceae bacterium]
MPDFLNSEARTDHSLLRQFRGGQVDAATELYSRYATRLLELAKSRTGAELGQSVDPEDVVQSVFRTFFRRAAEGSYQVPNGDTLWKLLMVIALNKIRSLADYHRAGKRDMRRTQPMQGTLPADHEQESLNILQITIAELTSQLHESHQQIIRMRIEGYGVDEIATKVQRSKRTTERVLQAFREQLFAAIHECGVDTEDKDSQENPSN